MRIIEHDWTWAAPLVTRRKAVKYLVVHHAAGDLTAEAIHRVHLDKKWSGIGYQYVVELDGDIHRGRPEGKVGAHCNEHNDESIGVCFSGNYETRKTMPAKQLAAGRELLADLRRRYPKAKVVGHGSMPDNATACPGRYFPMDALLGAAPAPAPAAKHIAKSLRPVLKQRMLRYALVNGVSLADCAGLGIVDSKGKPSTVWGDVAKRLAWRVSGALTGVEQGTQPTVALWKALGGK